MNEYINIPTNVILNNYIFINIISLTNSFLNKKDLYLYNNKIKKNIMKKSIKIIALTSLLTLTTLLAYNNREQEELPVRDIMEVVNEKKEDKPFIRSASNQMLTQLTKNNK